MGKLIEVDSVRFNGIKTATSKKGNAIGFVMFNSLELGEMELFISPTEINEEMKKQVGQTGSLSLDFYFEKGNERVRFLQFKPNQLSIKA